MAETVRYIGVNDEQTSCDHCGREDLARTVVLEMLDAEQNGTGETVRYGSTCAARALAPRGIRTTARRVLDAATAAHRDTVARAENAAATLGYYGLPLSGGATDAEVAAATGPYAAAHSLARWAATADWAALVRESVERHQASIAEAGLIGWAQ